jgi:UDP-N-acetylmuramate: L-alanyl-gamma-D-glutamyl-meso-diaminopimelate ligase
LFAYSQNIPMDKIKSAVSHLEMVKRRQEERGYYRGALIIDDFAHHPTAVRLTLDGLKSKYPQKELVVVFAPSSATARSSYFQKEFTESLFIAKEVILVPSKVKTTVKSGENLDITKMIKDLNEHQVKASSCESLDALLGALDRTVESKNEKLIVILSNGSILGLWESRFVQELNQK